MIETQLKKIEETLEKAIAENVTVNLRGYFFQNFEKGRTKERAFEMAAILAKVFGFGTPSKANHEGIRWLEVGDGLIHLIIYYTPSQEEEIAEVKETLVKLEA